VFLTRETRDERRETRDERRETKTKDETKTRLLYMMYSTVDSRKLAYSVLFALYTSQ
jgi:hypothetical protein